MPSLSALMPNYNHASYVTQAVETIAQQSRPPDEFIIIDDGSTDRSVEVIQGLVRRFPWIRFERNERNLGLYRTFERLLGMATGDYLYLPAADDYILPGFFEKAMAMAAEHPQAAIVFGQFQAIDETGKELFLARPTHWDRPLYASPERYLRDIIDGEAPSIAFSGSSIYRRAPLEEVGYFRKELGSWSDTFGARAMALKYGVCYLPEIFMIWRVMRTSFSQTTGQDPRKLLDIIDRAAWLMRSPEFRDRFPEASVARWRSAYRLEVIGAHNARVEASYQDLMTSYRKVADLAGGADGLLMRLGLKAMSLARRLLEWRSRKAMLTYRGDLSCYDTAGAATAAGPGSVANPDVPRLGIPVAPTER